MNWCSPEQSDLVLRAARRLPGQRKASARRSCSRFRGIFFTASAALSVSLVHGAGDYRLEVVAHSPDFPADPAATHRAFSIPQVNAAGQVLFKASWCLGRAQEAIYVGRPGSLSEVYRLGNPSPIAGLKFAGAAACSFGVAAPSFNASGEVLFRSGLEKIDPNDGLPPPVFDIGLWQGTAGDLRLTAALVSQSARFDPNRPPPAPQITNAPPAGAGRLQYFTGVDHRLSDDGDASFEAELEVLGFDPNRPTEIRTVASRALISGRRLILYKDGPAPGLGGDYVFRLPFGDFGDLVSPMAAGQKTGDFVAATKVSLSSQTDPEQFKTAFYQSVGGVLSPFYVEGNPLPEQPTPMEVFGANEPYKLTVAGAFIADANGNTLLEATATSADGFQIKPLGIWKKLPGGLVRALRYDIDYPVSGGTVRFLGLPSDSILPRGRSAMADEKMAFVARFSGLGQNFSRGIFRETDSGFELVAHDGMVVPGTSFVLGNIPDSAGTPPLLMNNRGEVAFVAVYHLGPNTSARALWVFDRVGALRRAVHTGQVIRIGMVDHTIKEFYFNHDEFPTPHHPDMFFNDGGVIVVPVDFTHDTPAVPARAILRAVPEGYVDPVPLDPAPSLTIVRNADQTVTLSWRGAGTLEQSDSLAAPDWQPAPIQENPQTIIINAERMFYRLRR